MKSMPEFDVVILTDARYVNPKFLEQYVSNILLEDELVSDALSRKGMKVTRKSWDDSEFNWENTKSVLFRSTWDYTRQLNKFRSWLEEISSKTQLVNSREVVEWNINKKYLAELESKGIKIVHTTFIDAGSNATLEELQAQKNWDDMVLKPSIGAGGRNTFRLNQNNIGDHEKQFKELIKQEDFMLQPFQKSILEQGEWSFMIFDGAYSHAVIKKARQGEFRVQDDFGGRVIPYDAAPEEIEFAIKAVAQCPGNPAYARVDFVIDNEGERAISEIELIEPELWFRFKPEATDLFADKIIEQISR